MGMAKVLGRPPQQLCRTLTEAHRPLLMLGSEKANKLVLVEIIAEYHDPCPLRGIHPYRKSFTISSRDARRKNQGSCEDWLCVHHLLRVGPCLAAHISPECWLQKRSSQISC